MDERLIKEKEMAFRELISIMNKGLGSEHLTSEVLRELRDKIDKMLENDF